LVCARQLVLSVVLGSYFLFLPKSIFFVLARKFFLPPASKLLMTPLFDDFSLIAALQARNETAFRYLVEKYQNQVFNTVLGIVQDVAEAEDVAQEVFIEIYESVGRFRHEARFTTWIYRIATNKALENHRRRKTQKRFAFLVNLFGENNEVKVQPSDFVHPGIQLEQQESAQTLFRHIDKLPDNQKIAFTLCHIEGLSYVEIAEVMQNSVGAVESLLFRAKSQLRKTLKGHYEQAKN
jgi:RNA polymerase sigma factor (sigma-70 family)